MLEEVLGGGEGKGGGVQGGEGKGNRRSSGRQVQCVCVGGWGGGAQILISTPYSGFL
jgi:hypothetical protein